MDSLKTKVFLYSQKLKESLLLTESLYFIMLVSGVLFYCLRQKKLSFRFLSQVHRSSRNSIFQRAAFGFIPKLISLHRTPRDPHITEDQFRVNLGSRIMCIKPRVSNNEKGVLLIKYSESMPLLPFFCDMPRLLKDYVLVYEPSWSGYCTGDILHFACYTDDVYFLAKQKDDFQFLKALDCNLIPVDMGPCDWVNPAIAQHYLSQDKQFDIVMNSNWSTAKRHQVLFHALSCIPEKLKVALIGFEWGGRTKDEILTLARFFGVAEQLTFYEKISFEDVMKVNCQSRMAILLSLKEGSNRSISEALFCNIPAIVLENHIGGIVGNINAKTGVLVNEKSLSNEITRMLENLEKFTPLEWAQNNISCTESTRRLNSILKQRALDRGEVWSKDLIVRTNSPDLRYLDNDSAAECIQDNAGLSRYIRA